MKFLMINKIISEIRITNRIVQKKITNRKILNVERRNLSLSSRKHIVIRSHAHKPKFDTARAGSLR